MDKIITIISTTIFPVFTLLWIEYKNDLKKYEEKREDLLWGDSALRFLESGDRIHTVKGSGELVGQRNLDVSILRAHMERCEFMLSENFKMSDKDTTRIKEFGYFWDCCMMPALRSEQELCQNKKLPDYNNDYWKHYPLLYKLVK